LLVGSLALAMYRTVYTQNPVPRDARVPLAVIGDSDSHSYHDRILLSRPIDRGGPYRATTYQWTDVLAALRGGEVDLGEWGTWGQRPKIAAVLRALGFDGRTPRKQDFRFNFAISGATCDDLHEPPQRQTENLLRTMDEDRERWQRGIVVIRIGINSVGRTADLEHYAQHGLDAPSQKRLQECAVLIARSVSMIRAQHGTTLIIVTGMSDDTHWARNLQKWRDPGALARIGEVLERFDDLLEAAVRNDARAAFISDRRWFAATWGGRDASGAPAYRSISFGGAQPVRNAQGDHPSHVSLADGHAGTVSNGLWARDLVAMLRSRFAVRIAQIGNAEVASLADPRGEYGIAPRPSK
jgi:hypothetical protein